MTKKYDNPVGLKNRNKVLEAIAALVNPRPQEVVNWINDPNNSSDDFVNKLLSTVTGRHTTIPTADRYLPERIQKKISVQQQKESNNKRISIRAVQYWCAKLVEEGLAEHQYGGRYSITDKVKEDIRFLAGVWNFQALNKLCRSKDLEEFITRLGILIVYTLIQSTKPFNIKHKSTDYKDTLALDWIQNAVSLEHIFMCFLATFMPITKRGYRKEPRFELNQEKYDELSKMLKEIYPDFIQELERINIFQPAEIA